MLATLTALGEVLVVTANPGAILGARRVYPAMDFDIGTRHGQSVDGALDAEFVPWNEALAVCHEHENGSTHAVEFRDAAGAVLHKVCLTDRSARDVFVEWVEHHQAIGESQMPPDPLRSRWSTVQRRHWFDYDEIELLPATSVERVLHCAAAQKRAVRVIVGNEGMVHGADLAPRCLHARRQWLFASDDDTGLHFDPCELRETLLHRVPAAGGRPSALTLKAFTDDGLLRLALAAPRHESETTWTNFLTTALAES